MKRGREQKSPKKKKTDEKAEKEVKEEEEMEDEEAMIDKIKTLRDELLAIEYKLIDAREQRLPPPIDRLRKRCKELKITNYEPILKQAAPHLTRLSLGECSGVMTGRHAYYGWVNYYFVSYQWDEMRISYASQESGECGNNWGSVFLPEESGEYLTTHAYFNSRNCDAKKIREDFRPFNFEWLNHQASKEKHVNSMMNPLLSIFAEDPKGTTTSRGVDLSKLGIKPYLLPMYLYQRQPDESRLSDLEDAPNISSFSHWKEGKE